jgi:hypothetical protein
MNTEEMTGEEFDKYFLAVHINDQLRRAHPYEASRAYGDGTVHLNDTENRVLFV